MFCDQKSTDGDVSPLGTLLSHILTAMVLLPALSPLENKYSVFLSAGEEQPLLTQGEGDPWLPWLTLLWDSTVSTHLEVTVVTSRNYRVSVFRDHSQ